MAYSQFPLSYSIKTSSSSLSSHYCLQTPPPSLPPTSRCSCSSSSGSTRAGAGLPYYTPDSVELSHVCMYYTDCCGHTNTFSPSSRRVDTGVVDAVAARSEPPWKNNWSVIHGEVFFPCSFLHCRRMCNILGNIGGRQKKPFT